MVKTGSEPFIDPHQGPAPVYVEQITADIAREVGKSVVQSPAPVESQLLKRLKPESTEVTTENAAARIQKAKSNLDQTQGGEYTNLPWGQAAQESLNETPDAGLGLPKFEDQNAQEKPKSKGSSGFTGFPITTMTPKGPP